MATMTKDKVKALRAALAAALAASGIEKQFEVALEVGNASYTGHGATFRVEISELDARGEAITLEGHALDAVCAAMGVESLRGKTIVSRGVTYTITGYRRKAPKRPFLTRSSKDGREYVFPRGVVTAQHPFGYSWERKEGGK